MLIKLYRVSLGPLCLFRVGPRPLYTSYLQPAVVPLLIGVGPPRCTSRTTCACDPLWT